MIEPQNLGVQAREAIRSWIAQKRLTPGEPLREAQIAQELGISRTPLREAFLRLTEEGLVEQIPNRGFRLPLLDEGVVRQIYPIIGALESLAVRSSEKNQLRELLPVLQDLAKKMGAPSTNMARLYELDYRWHQTLVSACENDELKELIERYKRRARQYDGAWKRGMADPEGSIATHTLIENAIDRGRLAHAGRLLQRHWDEGIEVVVRWLRERTT